MRFNALPPSPAPASDRCIACIGKSKVRNRKKITLTSLLFVSNSLFRLYRSYTAAIPANGVADDHLRFHSQLRRNVRGRFRDNNSPRNLSPSFPVMNVKTLTSDVANCMIGGHPLSTSIWGLAQKRTYSKGEIALISRQGDKGPNSQKNLRTYFMETPNHSR